MAETLQGKKILLGVTGSIAAYKAAYLVRALVKKGADVQVVMTDAGKKFITPVTLAALSGKGIISEFFASSDGTWHSHVDLGIWADVMLVAPATANTLGKMANGIADNMLVTCYLSCKAPVFIAPAMDLDMYAHPATQRNVELLRSYGNHIIEPVAGELASHLSGKGRMEDPDRITEILEQHFTAQGQLLKKKIVITAGPTYEKIDPVRFIGNYSSGKMGFALAAACARRGAEVILISGPVALETPCSGIRRINVESAGEMYRAAISEFQNADAALMCAAVADFRPEQVAGKKIKRSKDDMILHLTPNPDIAAELGRLKRAGQVLAGFALETDAEETNALSKLEKKNFDFIVLNSLRDAGAGFRYDTNKVTIIERCGRRSEYDLKSKNEVAADIVSVLAAYLT